MDREKAGAPMRRTAFGIMLVGLLLVAFRIPFMGMDLLIDAVGYLLVCNGLWALHKVQRLYPAWLPGVCLPLVLAAALQLFFSVGTVLLITQILCLLLECILYVAFAAGVVADLRDGQKRQGQGSRRAMLPAGVVWPLAGLGVVASLALLLHLLWPVPGWPLEILHLLAHLPVMLLLLCLLVWPPAEAQAGKR